LDFQNFKFLVGSWAVCAYTYQRTTFHQNWSNGCEDMAFKGFHNDDCPSSLIFF